MWPWNKIKALRAQLSAATRLVESLNAHCNMLAKQCQRLSNRQDELQRQNTLLRAQLAEATKNDQRDPATGRFTKTGD